VLAFYEIDQIQLMYGLIERDFIFFVFLFFATTTTWLKFRLPKTGAIKTVLTRATK